MPTWTGAGLYNLDVIKPLLSTHNAPDENKSHAFIYM